MIAELTNVILIIRNVPLVQGRLSLLSAVKLSYASDM